MTAQTAPLMRRPPRPALIIAAALLAGGSAIAGCASPGATAQVGEIEPRLRATLTQVHAGGSQEHWYGLYQGDSKYGYMSVQRRVEPTFIEITTRIVARLGEGGDRAEITQDLVERFDAAPPCAATLLRSVTEGYGRTLVATIRRRGEYYLAASDDVPDRALGDFQFSLADRLAPETWVASTPAPESCLAYPAYRLEDFTRTWLTECIVSYGEGSVAGDLAPVANILRLHDDGSATAVQRAMDGHLLIDVLGPDSYLRSEPAEHAQSLPADPTTQTL